MAAIGRDDLANDASLSDNAGRDARRDEIYAVIDQWVGRHTEAEVLATLEQAEKIGMGTRQYTLKKI